MMWGFFTQSSDAQNTLGLKKHQYQDNSSRRKDCLTFKSKVTKLFLVYVIGRSRELKLKHYLLGLTARNDNGLFTASNKRGNLTVFISYLIDAVFTLADKLIFPLCF